jgi:hypothetical protein
MARKETRESNKRKALFDALPFTKTNYRILICGIAVIILGYVALSQEPWDGFWPLDVAPVLLALGYCVLIPLGILFRKRDENRTDIQQPQPGSENSH